MNQTLSKQFFYPPGGVLIWILITLEVLTFLGGIIVFMLYRKDSLIEFMESRQSMNSILATINTAILISSGYLVAMSVAFVKKGIIQKAARFTLISTILGALFLVIKGYEYYLKIELGMGLGFNNYFSLYWLLTGFHFVHVLFGTGMLLYMFFALRDGKYSATNYEDVESSASFWHMCDLIWVFIFPIFYLI